MDPLERTRRLATALRRLGLVMLLSGVSGGPFGALAFLIVLGFLLRVVAISSGATRRWFAAAAAALATSDVAAWVFWKHPGSVAGATVIACGGAALLLGVLGCRQLATWFGGMRRWTVASVLAGYAAFGLATMAGYVAARPLVTDERMRFFGVHTPAQPFTVVVSIVALATLIATWRAFVDLEARVTAAVDRAARDRAEDSAHG